MFFACLGIPPYLCCEVQRERVQKLVTGLTVRDKDQIYEILGRPLIDPTTSGAHRASQERQNSRVGCVGFYSKSEDCTKCVRVY